jgi:hypothetical protein
MNEGKYAGHTVKPAVRVKFLFSSFPAGGANKHYAPSFCRRCLAFIKIYYLFFQ